MIAGIFCLYCVTNQLIMPKHFALIALIFLFAGKPAAYSQQKFTPAIQPQIILKNTDVFLTYIAGYKPKQDFIAYNSSLKPINKLQFLQKLKTGEYIPLRLHSNDLKMHYSLYKINPISNKDISEVMSAYALYWLNDYLKVGKKFPAFNLADINGNKYNATNTKGKTLVVKCWFIGCLRCEEEMPELNQLKARYKNRKDIIFISLALDSKTKLQAFLKRKRFDFPIVPNQRNFMESALKVNAYPTHFIVNKNGIIANVVDDPEDIEWTLQHI